jgi:hypothetical protein
MDIAFLVGDTRSTQDYVQEIIYSQGGAFRDRAQLWAHVSHRAAFLDCDHCAGV